MGSGVEGTLAGQGCTGGVNHDGFGSFLVAYEEAHPDQVVHIHKEVDARWEAAAIVVKSHKEMREPLILLRSRSRQRFGEEAEVEATFEIDRRLPLLGADLVRHPLERFHVDLELPVRRNVVVGCLGDLLVRDTPLAREPSLASPARSAGNSARCARRHERTPRSGPGPASPDRDARKDWSR